MKSIHWFRNDLRLADNPALSAASGNDVLPIFILDPIDSEGMGAASKLWLHHSLKKLCLLYTSPSPRDRTRSRMPSSA